METTVDEGRAKRWAKAGVGAGGVLLLLAALIKGLQGSYWWAIMLFVLAVMLFLLIVLAMTFRFLSGTGATKVTVRPGSIEYEGPLPSPSGHDESEEPSVTNPPSRWWKRWVHRKG
jgi:hypothetical protein